MTTEKFHEKSFWIPAGNGAPLFAAILMPERPRAAMLVFNPFAEERKGCLKPLVDFSRRMAAAEVAVLRFDYSGCGDSPGAFGAGGVDAWRRDAAAAAGALAKMIPATLPRFWLGARGGAMLAADVAARIDPSLAPDAILLWEPVDGAAFVKQLIQKNRVNTMIAFGAARKSLEEIEAAWGAGEGVDLDGYVFPSTLVAGLRALGPVPVNRPVHAIRIGTDPKPTAALRGVCPQFTDEQLRLPPFWNTVGQVDASALLDSSERWLLSKLSGNKALGAPGTDSAKQGTDSAILPENEGTDSTISGRARCVLRHVEIDGPEGRIRGVMHLPDGKNGAPFSGAVLFLHGWSGDRTGPHGLFTEAAGILCERGMACLRIDFGGRGASDGAASDASIARMAEEARAALAFLLAETGAADATVVAICSGCKVALTLASKDPRVARLALWSAESMGSLRDGATGWRKTRAALAAYARKLCRLETWKKILKRQVRAGMVGKALAGHETRSPEEARREDSVLRDLRRFKGEMLFVYGGSDPDAPGSSKAYKRFCARNGIRAADALVPHAGHSYYAADWTAELLRETISWLDSRLPRH